MKSLISPRILGIALIVLTSVCLRAADEAQLISILKSSAGVPEKCLACQQLRIHGSVASVPALAAVLGDDRIGHAARYALEGMPYPEAGHALRQALSQTSGLLQAGIIDSLGQRRDPLAVPSLVPFLADTHPLLVAAAATALSRIANPEAITALTAAREVSNPMASFAVQEGLLRCAEHQLAAGNPAEAASIYRGLLLPDVPPSIRTAAWRGLALSDANQRPSLIVSALAGTDAPRRSAALQLVRETHDPRVVQTCLQQWNQLPAEAQVAVLEAHPQPQTVDLTTLRLASQSPHPSVRIAAWQASANAHEPALIPALARAAAHGDTAERAAARDALARIQGPGIRDALFAHLQPATPAEQAELLRTLGDRRDTAAADRLLDYSAAADRNVRLAALDSLQRLALPDTLLPLLRLAADAKSDADRSPILRALYTVCHNAPAKDQSSLEVIAALNALPVDTRRPLLPLLAELATPAALNELEATILHQDADLAREAVRSLSQWPNPAPATRLLELASSSSDRSTRTLALRGGITLAGLEPNPRTRLALLQQALSLATQPEERRLVLGQLGQIPQPEALQTALQFLTDPALTTEAALAAISIAETLAAQDQQLGDQVAQQVLAHCDTPAIVQRAWTLRLKPAAGGPFIRDWLVSGPYHDPTATGATALFDTAFAPEQAGDDAQWLATPSDDSVNLAALFPGQDSCVAYLKTQLIAPETTDALLLMGSDDGIKVWLNGVVVHRNNVDRGQVVDQDLAPIQLQRGTNEILIKVTQGGGGWSACARIVGSNGHPIEGLQTQLQPRPAP